MTMLTAWDLSEAQRLVLRREFDAVRGRCPCCLTRMGSPVMWWAHIDIDHANSPHRRRLAGVLT